MYESGHYIEPWPIKLAKGLQVSRLMRLAKSRGAVIVSYHGVVADRDWQDWETADMVAESVFRKHLAFYRKYYSVLPLKRMVEGLQGNEPLPPRALAITFDDGYRNNLLYAVPALKEFGLAATFFLTTGFLDGTDELWWLPVKRFVMQSRKLGKNCLVPVLGSFAVDSHAEAGSSYQKILTMMKTLPESERRRIVELLRNKSSGIMSQLKDVYKPMTWSDAKNIVKSGMEIGAHSVSHTIMAQESEEKIRQEIFDSVKKIQSESGMKFVSFSYPDGQQENCRQSIKAAVREAGCYAGLMNFSGVNGKGDDFYELRRFPVGGHHTPLRLEMDLCGLRALKNRLTGFHRIY